MAVNTVTLVGNLVRSPEVRSTASGNVVMNFDIAVNEREKNAQTGEWTDVPSFFPCTMFGNRAEALSRYLGKGGKVAVRGHLKQRRWEAKDGTKRSKVEIIVEDLEFMSRRSEEPAYEEPSRPAPQAPEQAASMEFAYEDLPF